MSKQQHSEENVLYKSKPTGLVAWETAFKEKSAKTFAMGFTHDVIIEASVLRKPVKGIELASRFLWEASTTYESLEFTHYFSEDSYTCVQWQATAFGGKKLFGSTIIHTNEHNKIDHAIIQHRPLDVLLEYSAEQNRRLSNVGGEGYFYENSD